MEEYREYRARILLQLCPERTKSGHKQQDKLLLNIRKTVNNGVVELGKSLRRKAVDKTPWSYEVCRTLPAKTLRNLLEDCPRYF